MSTVAIVPLTVTVVRLGDQVLLGRKKKGFGAGRWNGFGGKVEAGETIVQAAARELTEESGLVAHELEQRGVVHALFTTDTDFSALGSAHAGVHRQLDVHLFMTTMFSGQVQETDEMEPRWFAIADIPYDAMWPDDQFWLPRLLAGGYCDLTCMFNADHQLLSHDMKRLAKPAASWHIGEV